MSHVTVDEILQRIEQLPEEDRILLEQRLAQRVEAQWRRAAEEARLVAGEKGIDQATIDQAVRDLRYPQ